MKPLAPALRPKTADSPVGHSMPISQKPLYSPDKRPQPPAATASARDARQILYAQDEVTGTYLSS
ncbi:dihydroxy-acetone synthase [Aspergillus luchuensis]|uniref:Dihydroxy-acetone synthase n=1 Tax=Aspergillus kawachii TaxID=1069201 RepID=A0A146F8F8_ASPKA|nr:dihydroxy-acetone synthase [Aspergillus luchuensis]